MDPGAFELAKTFGIAAPLVAALFYLLWAAEQREQRASAERKETSDKFLLTLSGVIADSRLTNERLTVAVSELAAAVREARQQDREEHKAIVDAIGKLPIGRQSG